MQGSVTAYQRKLTVYHFYYCIIKGQHRKQKVIEHNIQNET